MKITKLILSASISFASLSVQGQTNDTLEVTKATQNFVKAFINFDWKSFRNSFSSDATIFFPSWEKGKRRIGQKEIEETWLEIFPEFIDSTKKFDLKIDPKNIFMQLYGNTAIVSFHLTPADNYLSRRTLVFIKANEKWKIVHLHASSVSGGK